jgi:hypothetical protein
MRVIVSPFVFRDSQTQGDHFPWYPNLNIADMEGLSLISVKGLVVAFAERRGGG